MRIYNLQDGPQTCTLVSNKFSNLAFHDDDCAYYIFLLYAIPICSQSVMLIDFFLRCTRQSCISIISLIYHPCSLSASRRIRSSGPVIKKRKIYKNNNLQILVRIYSENDTCLTVYLETVAFNKSQLYIYR